ncbi:hypothetical protein [Brevundimonas goettingensis]|uniref:Uncharacterized protein n=1 Tax=Brevundimonas goettingensis TaxID=2774190 RepID=A0A975GVC3_9CAUL|nr:hypothetical protein [Brevundimonas goettingensis]QTC90458.1 hypothetical protein IFJ75_14395 [Brevundimonas goettingensis]
MKRVGKAVLKIVYGFALLVSASGPAVAEASRQDRAAYLDRFEAEGLSEQVFIEVLLWGEGMHLMGRCHTHLRADQIEHWKTWWDDSVLADTVVGREVIQEGLEEFDRGVVRYGSEPLNASQCSAVIRDWLGEMSQAAEAERVP